MKVKLNPIFEEMSGAFGEIVFRTSNGKTIMARKPDMSGTEASEDQAAHRERFREAVAYGKSVMADAEVRAIYDEVADRKNTPIFALTVADFFNAPIIHNVDLAAYEGKVGDVIKVRASDDFGVMSVQVTITNAADDAVIENLPAVETASGSGLWVFTAAAAVSAGTMVNINVVATDRPGGMAVDSKMKAL